MHAGVSHPKYPAMKNQPGLDGNGISEVFARVAQLVEYFLKKLSESIQVKLTLTWLAGKWARNEDVVNF